MPSPTASTATLRPDLGGSMEEFNLAASRLGFVGLRLWPVFEAAKQAGSYGVIPIEQLLQKRETLRAPGGHYNRGQFKFTPQAYATVEHGVEEPIDDRESQMYAEYFDAELVSAARARDAVLRNFEERVIDGMTDTTIWTGAALTTAVSTAWTDTANATPIDDVRDAILKVWEGSGLMPNAVAVSYNRFQHLKDNAQIIDRVKYAGRQDPNRGNVNAAAIAEAFGVEELIVAGSQENTANEGLAASLGSIWPDARVAVCRVAHSNDIREPCVGRTIHWGEDGSQIGSVMETYRDETIRGDVARARMDTDEKRMYTEASHLLTAC